MFPEFASSGIVADVALLFAQASTHNGGGTRIPNLAHDNHSKNLPISEVWLTHARTAHTHTHTHTHSHIHTYTHPYTRTHWIQGDPSVNDGALASPRGTEPGAKSGEGAGARAGKNSVSHKAQGLRGLMRSASCDNANIVPVSRNVCVVFIHRAGL